MTAFELAQRFVGEVKEHPGAVHSPFIQWCHESCGFGPETADEVPWCSSFANRIAWLLRLPRSKSAAARSWLTIGTVVPLITDAIVGDIIILSRGAPPSGHVGFFAGYDPTAKVIHILGGNQSDGVTVADFPVTRLLGIRRLS
jgi:uncharacterized protein (TIGR02594 family)